MTDGSADIDLAYAFPDPMDAAAGSKHENQDTRSEKQTLHPAMYTTLSQRLSRSPGPVFRSDP